MNLTLPEMFKIVEGHEPAAADAVANTSDAISCKNLKKVWAILHHYSAGGDTDVVVTWYEGTDVAFGTASATCFWSRMAQADGALVPTASSRPPRCR